MGILWYVGSPAIFTRPLHLFNEYVTLVLPGCPSQAPPQTSQHRMCQEHKSYNIYKWLLWLPRSACYFGNYVVIATQGRQHNSSLRSSLGCDIKKRELNRKQRCLLSAQICTYWDWKGEQRFLEVCHLCAGCWIILIKMKNPFAQGCINTLQNTTAVIIIADFVIQPIFLYSTLTEGDHIMSVFLNQ